MSHKKFRLFFLITLLSASLILGISLKKCFLTERAYITVAGAVKMGDGIGRLAVDFMDALYDEVTINFLPTRKTACLADVPERIVPIVSKKEGFKKLGKILIYHEPFPGSIKKMPKNLIRLGRKNSAQIRIAYSMNESSQIPPLWVKILNKQFDAVAVPDEFLVEVYKNCGVEIPIFVLPLGLDLSQFLNQPVKSSRNTPFCFINTSSMISRKNHEGLIKAFNQAFEDNPDVQLIMNYRYCMGEAMTHARHLIESLNVHNILLTDEKLDNKQYLDFFLKGDVFVSLSKGEGFSIQPREAMALGLPVIISDNTAHKTIIESGLACGIICPTTEIAHNPVFHCDCGEEYIADINEAAKAFREIYENYEKYLNEALKRRQWVAMYQYENLKPLYLSLVKPKKIILSDKNQVTTDTLFTTSKDLYDKYIRHNVIALSQQDR